MTLYRRLLVMGRPHVPELLLAHALRLLAAGGDVGMLLAGKQTIDAVAKGAPVSGALAIALSLALLRQVAAYLGDVLSARASLRWTADLQERLLGAAHRSPLTAAHRAAPGDVAARVFHDAQAAASLLTETITLVMDAPVRALALIAVLFWLDPALAAVVMLVLAPGIVLGRLFGRRLRGRVRGVNAELGELYDAVYETLSAAELVHAFGAVETEIEAFAARNRRWVRAQVALLALHGLHSPLGQGLRVAALGAAFALGVHHMATGTLTAGALAAALAAAWALLGAAQTLLVGYTSVQVGLAAAERVFAVLDEPIRVPAPALPRPARFERALRLEGVSFAYPDGRRAIEDVSISITPGEHIALVGASGSGKTTLLRLLLRLFDPAHGRVTLDGVDLRELDLGGLRRLFAVVLPDAVLLHRSVADNVRYGRPEATESEVQEALARVGLAEVVAALPRGVDEVLGPRGVTLSSGERQRLALARAIVRPAPVLLLDEPTSALDSATEEVVQQALRALARARTVVTISHRLTAVREAGRFVVLDAGRVVQDGARDALLESPGPLRRMWQAQGLVWAQRRQDTGA